VSLNPQWDSAFGTSLFGASLEVDLEVGSLEVDKLTWQATLPPQEPASCGARPAQQAIVQRWLDESASKGAIPESNASISTITTAIRVIDTRAK
ncbi:MAG: hypothetical protein ACRD4L_11970, partial [Pyrinomonadaceae bacterium]